jgi:hypothetical protein
MPGTDTKGWETARRQVLTRWRDILERIRNQDEGGALELINTMDEFCDEADRSRESVQEGAGSRCVFCRSFIEHGGCFGLLGEINRAVLHGKWKVAHGLATTNIKRLEAADFSALSGSMPALKAAPGRTPGGKGRAS